MSYLPNHHVTFEPIQAWPGEPTRFRNPSPFSKSWSGVLRMLDHELHKLRSKRVVIQVSLDRSRIRQDGAPRADAIIRDPRVILSFDSRHGPQQYPCDTYDSNRDLRGWQANLYAIAKSLEALRMVDRYGVTKSGQQYRGFESLPAPDAPPFADGATALAWLRNVIDSPTATARDAYRAAQVVTHPDRGGSAEKFKQVTAAGRMLNVA